MSKWGYLTFSDVITDETKNATKIKKDKYLPSGKYQIIDQGQEQVAGYTNDEVGIYTEVPAIIFGDHTRIIKYVDKPLFLGADGVKLLKIKKNCLDYKFLYYYFVKNKVPNTGYNRHFKWLKELSIPVPPLDIQKHIADTLDKTQEIIDGHKKQLEELDNLIKATFYDMFGDPIINEKRWEEEKLMDACDKITDGTHDTPPRYKQGVLLVTGKNVRPFEIDLTDVEYVSQGDHDIIYKRCNPEFKDVLYTNIGVNYGTAAINLFHYEFSMKNVALLKYKRNVLTGEYLQCYLNYKREYIIDQNKTGGAQTFMGLATIKQINIIIPPLDLQNKFAQIVTKIEEQKSLVKQLITESQNLLNSLMSKYFD